jgi:hypothetical protein
VSASCGGCDGRGKGEKGGTELVGCVVVWTDCEMVRMEELSEWGIWQV